MFLCLLWHHTSHGSPETQTDPITTGNVDLVMAWATNGFNPAGGLRRGLTIVPHQSEEPWCGFRGHDGAKLVISRTVTSETHFPTIKERETKRSGTNADCFHSTESNISACECVSWTSSHSQKCLHTLVSFPSCVVIKHFQMCLLQRTKVDCEPLNREPN